MHENQHVKKLINPPLKEVVFDIRWELDIDEETKRVYDSKFDIALGKFHNEINKEFPKINRVVPPFVPKELLTYAPQYQFLTEDKDFPLIQLGEGMLSINDDDESYEWSNKFFPLIKKTLNKIDKSYNNELKIEYVSLRYIDAVDLDSENYLEFLEEKLNYKVEKKFTLKGDLEAFNFKEKIKIDDIVLSLNFSTGRDEVTNKVQLIWQYIAVKEGYQTKEQVLKWVEEAHNVTSNLFRTMLNPKFYDSFTKKQ